MTTTEESTAKIADKEEHQAVRNPELVEEEKKEEEEEFNHEDDQDTDLNDSFDLLATTQSLVGSGDEGNNNEEEQVKQSETEEAAVGESEMDQTLESEPGCMGPGPFEPDLRKSPVGPERRTVTFPAIDVRKSRRDERLRRKAEIEEKIARMITDSTMKIEVAMEYDRNGKPFIY